MKRTEQNITYAISAVGIGFLYILFEKSLGDFPTWVFVVFVIIAILMVFSWFLVPLCKKMIGFMLKIFRGNKISQNVRSSKEVEGFVSSGPGIEKRVSQTGKDSDGDITRVCHPGAEWSPRSSSLVITDIENDWYQYYVINSKGGRTYIEVVDGPTRKYLRTKRDETPCDNLDELPDC